MNETVQIKAESEQWETWGEMGGRLMKGVSQRRHKQCLS